MRRSFDTFIFLTFALTAFSHASDALAADPRQVIVARVPDDTTATVEHGVGDPTALLHVDNAPPNLETILKRQVGEWCPKIERRHQIGSVTTFLLVLSDSRTTPRIRFGQRPRAMRVELRHHERPSRPEAKRVIGRIASLAGRKTSNLGVLPASIDGPACANHPKQCAHFETAKEAARALRRGQAMDPFEGWAFRFHQEKPWLRSKLPYAFASLAAVQVLVAQNMLSEAETMITVRRGLRSPRFAPYTALTLAEIYDRTDRTDEAQRIRDSVIETVEDGGLQTRALVAALRADIKQGRFVAAAERVENLPEAKVKTDDAQAEAWTLAAEVAIAVGDPEGAYARYRQAWGYARDQYLRASIELRLGDLDLYPAGDRRNVERHYRAASKGDACTVARVSLRRAILEDESREYTLIERLNALSKDGRCFAVRMEAAYAAAFLASADGRDRHAIAILEDARQRSGVRASRAWGVEVAVLDAIRTILDTWTNRMWRARAWPELIGQFDGPYRRYRDLLPPTATIRLSQAYRHMRAASEVSEELLAHIRSGRAQELEQTILAELAESYRNDRDDLRAEVTARFLLERDEESSQWGVRLLLAEMRLAVGNAAAAMGHLDNARHIVPEGDARQRWRRLRAEALNALEKPEEAATALMTWLDGTPTPVSSYRAVAVNVTSACVRLCNRSLLERLLNRLETFDDGAVLTERTRVLAAQRGIALGQPTDEAKEPGVWNRFDRALAKTADLR